MLVKTWVFVILDLIIIGVLIKLLFKGFGIFFRAFWNLGKPIWMRSLSKNEDYRPETMMKVVLILFISIGLGYIEKSLFY